jgi:dihydrodipicolinate reductase
MHILVTGANGYVGQRLIPVLLQQGHTLYCFVRNKEQFVEENPNTGIQVLEVDYWRVLVADKKGGRLLLFAEMKVPGEVWLEFKIMKKDNKTHLRQTANFRPKGVWGRLYWYAVLPFHFFMFDGMIKIITKNKPRSNPRLLH